VRWRFVIGDDVDVDDNDNDEVGASGLLRDVCVEDRLARLWMDEVEVVVVLPRRG
jgi:hypothetical protein